jgi:predicted molibdopterin-dependent oxidoreductase YjgC
LAGLAPGQLAPRFQMAEGAKLVFGELPQPGAPAEGALVLVAGPVFQHNGTLSAWSAAIAEVCPKPWLEMHPADAAEHDLRAGEVARIAGPSGVQLTAPVRLNAKLCRGILFAPTHFADFPVGRLLAESPYAAVLVSK